MSFRKSLSKAKLKLSDASPAILLGVGIVGFVGTVVLACYETTKANTIIEEHDKDMDDIRVLEAKKASDDPEYRDDEYTEKDAQHDKLIVAVHTGVKLTKLYAPAVIVGGLSITCFLASYKILNRRYLAAASLAAALSESFLEYRRRVKDRFGEDVERQLYFNTSEAEITVDEGDGKKPKTIKADVMGENSIPLYAKFFDEANRQWNKNPSVNLMFLKGVENMANDKFKLRGHLFLNEVYEMLDIPMTELGSEVGWFESHGDQFVDFGIFNGNDERKRAFVNGYEPSILLSFNCVPRWEGDIAKY